MECNMKHVSAAMKYFSIQTKGAQSQAMVVKGQFDANAFKPCGYTQRHTF